MERSLIRVQEYSKGSEKRFQPHGPRFDLKGNHQNLSAQQREKILARPGRFCLSPVDATSKQMQGIDTAVGIAAVGLAYGQPLSFVGVFDPSSMQTKQRIMESVNDFQARLTLLLSMCNENLDCIEVTAFGGTCCFENLSGWTSHTLQFRLVLQQLLRGTKELQLPLSYACSPNLSKDAASSTFMSAQLNPPIDGDDEHQLHLISSDLRESNGSPDARCTCASKVEVRSTHAFMKKLGIRLQAPLALHALETFPRIRDWWRKES